MVGYIIIYLVKQAMMVVAYRVFLSKALATSKNVLEPYTRVDTELLFFLDVVGEGHGLPTVR